MYIFKKSKFILASAAVLGALVVSQSAQADYTRSCESIPVIFADSPFANSTSVYALFGHTIVPEITIRGPADGDNTKKQRRLQAKALSKWVASECLNQWHSKAINALNAGQVDGKIAPPNICKDPASNVTFTQPDPAVVVSFTSTAASVDSMRWAYVTSNNSGWYEVMKATCSSNNGHSGVVTFTSQTAQGVDGECPRDYGTKTVRYTLTCNGGTPKHLTYLSGDIF